MALHEKIFLATATNGWVCPAGVKRVEIEGCGGGGGGGGGFYTTNSANLWLAGGSGGGGAKLGKVWVSVTPGVSYDITIGAGGSGGAGTTTSHQKATDGGDTIFKINGGATLVTFSGGGAGYSGGGTTSATIFTYTLGGQSTKFGSEQDVYSILWNLDLGGDEPNYLVRPDNRPHQGGFTVGTNDTSYTAASVASYGGPSDVVFGAAASFRGGAPSTNGTDAGTYRGGSSGGGGGAGAYGPGGVGANGGNANGSGQGANGGVVQAAGAGGANTGAGGGGGGAPGCGSSNVGVASAGAAGGSGRLIIRWTT